MTNVNLIQCGDHSYAPWSIVCVHLIGGATDWCPVPSDHPEVDHDWHCSQCRDQCPDVDIDDLQAICIHCVRELQREAGIVDSNSGEDEEQGAMCEDNNEPEFEEAFTIIDLPESMQPPLKKPEFKVEPVEYTKPSDEVRAHNERVEARNACYEPIYVDGNDTGTFRCSRRPRGWDDFRWRWSKELPWEADRWPAVQIQ